MWMSRRLHSACELLLRTRQGMEAQCLLWVNFECRQGKRSRGVLCGSGKQCKEQGTAAQAAQAAHAVMYLPPLSTLGALYPFLQGITFLLLHGACERLAGEGLIIILFIHRLVCFLRILNALLLTAGGNAIIQAQLASGRITTVALYLWQSPGG